MRLTLGQLISRLHNHKIDQPEPFCNQLIGYGIIILIQQQPFYGILLAKLDRRTNLKLRAPLGLGWSQHKIMLEDNPVKLAQTVKTDQELLFWLVHEALHLIWLHPVRYPSATYITQMATDLAVNQMIDYQAPNTITLNQVNQTLKVDLPSDVNSKVYVHLLKRYLKQPSDHNKEKALFKRRIKRLKSDKTDDHHLWGSEPQMGRGFKTMQLKRLVKRSYQNTSVKARGTLPGRVHQQLRRINATHHIDWRAYVKKGLGDIPFGRQPSRARFNRRQAYRMDLMGAVSNYIQPVKIFVDNSGSMGDHEISYLLGQLGDFLKHFPVSVTVYDFDTEVHGMERYQANNYHQIKFRRVGGGGTRFQCVFDYCHRNLNSNLNQLIIILTDGYGEKTLNYYGFTNLLWLLTTPKNHFSVQNTRGRLIDLSSYL